MVLLRAGARGRSYPQFSLAAIKCIVITVIKGTFLGVTRFTFGGVIGGVIAMTGLCRLLSTYMQAMCIACCQSVPGCRLTDRKRLP